MNGTTARWIVSGVIVIASTWVFLGNRNKKGEPEKKGDPPDSKSDRLIELKRVIIFGAVNCGLQNEIPGWKKEEVPGHKDIDKLSRLATVGWGRVVVSLIQSMSGDDGGSGAETAG